MRLLLILLAALSLPAHAKQPPDYLAFIAKAEKVAVIAHSVKSCERLGFGVDSAGILRLPDLFVTDAIYAGIDKTTALTMLASALKSERENQEFLVNQLKMTGNDDAAMNRFLDYWEARCEGLVTDPFSSPHFRSAP